MSVFSWAALQDLAVPTFVINRDHKIVLWNRACEDLTGMEAQAVLGTTKQWVAFYPEERPVLCDLVLQQDIIAMAERYCGVTQSLHIPGGMHAEGWFDNVGGCRRYLVFDAAPVMSKEGEVIAVTETLRDVTDLKNAEEWNSSLKQRVLDQAAKLRVKNEELTKLNLRIRHDTRAFVAVMARMLESSDEIFGCHGSNVAYFSRMLASHLHLDDEEQNLIEEAALLHDIGIIGMSEDALRHRANADYAPGTDEFQQHSIRGQAILGLVEDLQQVANVVRHHHENWAGDGYPDRMRGEDIPLGARIIAVTDAVDQAAWHLGAEATPDSILRAVQPYFGKKFDPALEAPVAKMIATFYQSNLRTKEVEEEVYSPLALRPGMMLSRDVYSDAGVLLLARGVRLTASAIDSILRLASSDGALHTRESIYVVKI